MRHPSMEMPAYIAAIFRFHLCTTHISQASLKFGEQLLPYVYIRLTNKFSLPSGTLLKLLRPIYGLPDAEEF